MKRIPFRIVSVCIFLTIVIFLVSSCAAKKEVVYQGEDFRETLLDTLVITDVANAMDSLPKAYNPSATMKYDITHTKLDLRFDWANQHVIGDAVITLKPFFKPIAEITLDAVNFDIKRINLLNQASDLKYAYDGELLTITLDRTYTRQESINLHIVYIAKPNEREATGSEAITSDKGLFFINPLGLDPDSPTQIWTQGETQNNSKWFPTFDRPNERFTQEIILTVDNKYKTLSNGLKIKSQVNPDGTRTDYWKQDKAHTPYLVMIAVGDFDEEQEMWQDIPVHYMVQKGFGKHAKKIFNHTPEMMTFFSKQLDYKYPWDKYAQVVVKDFVSGAMENTSASVFGDFIQKTSRELIDNNNDYIVAHELMHHWFGDLVTCEGWSNLTLNEGFANYAEYLWTEHKYGRKSADYHRMNEMNGYYGQVFGTGAHPLINYYYDNKEDMFDAHSYNKGGMVLHMLRNYVGDEAFYASLNLYLTTHAGTAVEVDELRMAFEDTIGEDLNWFFDQWFLGNGHPVIEVTYTYDEATKALMVTVDQSKTPKDFYQKFVFPTNVALYYADGSVEKRPLMIDEKVETFIFDDLKAKPEVYVFDGDNVLLAQINENKTEEQYKAQFKYSPLFMDKMIALSNISDAKNETIDLALEDDFYFIREQGLSAILEENLPAYQSILEALVTKDLHSAVRKGALERLLMIESYDPMATVKEVLLTEQAYPVLQVALEVYTAISPDEARNYATKFKNDDSDYLASAIIGSLSESDEDLNYIESKAKNIGMEKMYEYYMSYSEFLSDKSEKTLARSAIFLGKIASDNDANMYRKYMSVASLLSIYSGLNDMLVSPTRESNISKVKSIINDAVSKETNAFLKEKYQDIKLD